MSDISKTTINLPSNIKKELKIMAIREDTSLSGLLLKMINEGYEKRTGKQAGECDFIPRAGNRSDTILSVVGI